MSCVVRYQPNVLFYPSCGKDNIYPELFKLDFDLFVFCDFCWDTENVRDNRDARKFMNLSIHERANLTFDDLHRHYEKCTLSQCNRFWGDFKHKLQNQAPEVLHKDTDCIIFFYMGKKAILFLWDNNLTLAYLRDQHARIGCFIGVTDGCNEGGNYECVNRHIWLERVYSLSSKKGFTHINDHVHNHRCFSDGVTPIKIPYRDWLRSNILACNPLSRDGGLIIYTVPAETLQINSPEYKRLDYPRLFNMRKNKTEIMHDVLLSRGFLVEINEDGNLRLSSEAMLRKPGVFQNQFKEDNPVAKKRRSYKQEDKHLVKYKSDAKYLKELLKKSGLGEYNSRSRIIQLKSDNSPTEKQLSVILNLDNINWNVEPNFGTENPENFFSANQNLINGFKIPVFVLEPFIGLLVKAYSAIGVRTYSSCNGNGNQDATLSFSSYPNAIWADLVTRKAIMKTQAKCKWEIDAEGHLVISSDNYDAAYYNEIIEVARYILDNRNSLKKLRIEVTRMADQHKLHDRHYVRSVLEKGFMPYNKQPQ